ncbi:MAG: hypothetical protein HY244_14240 [Rhizobiales bacterium]|nr:hypothetical protein [Hyphomicrobiales bacterium]
MKFPILLRRGLSQEHEERWRQYYLQPSDRDRKREDGIWRRTQQQWNAAESGWRCPSDQRRRIVYYTHEYDLQRIGNRTDLVLRNTYIYYSLSLP